ncbi:MAG TPA: extracellular solute-binding protein, partial [Rhodocyclaceae bacterium]|nr:extracellular solute-binding protein [Rhodocyclaceae bacterium]
NDMYRAREDAKAAGRPFRIGMSIPKEGAVLAVDNFVLHKAAPRPDLAHRFIAFMLAGENAADVSNLIGAGNPNAAAIPHIQADIAGEVALFPKAEELKRLEMLRDLAPKQRRLLSRMWTEIKVR